MAPLWAIRKMCASVEGWMPQLQITAKKKKSLPSKKKKVFKLT